MKKCTWCGTDYPDEAMSCAVDGHATGLTFTNNTWPSSTYGVFGADSSPEYEDGTRVLVGGTGQKAHVFNGACPVNVP